jgi:hypothetical protein
VQSKSDSTAECANSDGNAKTTVQSKSDSTAECANSDGNAKTTVQSKSDSTAECSAKNHAVEKCSSVHCSPASRKKHVENAASTSTTIKNSETSAQKPADEPVLRPQNLLRTRLLKALAPPSSQPSKAEKPETVSADKSTKGSADKNQNSCLARLRQALLQTGALQKKALNINKGGASADMMSDAMKKSMLAMVVQAKREQHKELANWPRSGLS